MEGWYLRLVGWLVGGPVWMVVCVDVGEEDQGYGGERRGQQVSRGK